MKRSCQGSILESRRAARAQGSRFEHSHDGYQARPIAFGLDVPESETSFQCVVDSRVRTVVQRRQKAVGLWSPIVVKSIKRLIDRRDSYARLNAQLWVLLNDVKAPR